VLKDVGRDELTGAIRHVYAGREWIQSCIRRFSPDGKTAMT
jgi:DNA-binding NarL/FixJ family response regulator